MQNFVKTACQQLRGKTAITANENAPTRWCNGTVYALWMAFARVFGKMKNTSTIMLHADWNFENGKAVELKVGFFL